jgi:hypothetical protein
MSPDLIPAAATDYAWLTMKLGAKRVQVFAEGPGFVVKLRRSNGKASWYSAPSAEGALRMARVEVEQAGRVSK